MNNSGSTEPNRTKCTHAETGLRWDISREISNFLGLTVPQFPKKKQTFCYKYNASEMPLFGSEFAGNVDTFPVSVSSLSVLEKMRKTSFDNRSFMSKNQHFQGCFSGFREIDV